MGHHRNRQNTVTAAAKAQPDGSRSSSVYRGTVAALVSAIDAKDSYGADHADRVQRICQLMAGELGLDAHTIEGIRTAALLQDVGKLGVPDYILLKPGPLDHEEFSRMSNHATIGAGILAQVDSPWDLAGMVRYHHEKYDGTGYPHHLAGERIPLGSRIIAVAAVYEALVSKRAYREKWSHQEAVEHIEKLASTHFDPKVVKAFLAIQSLVAPDPQLNYCEDHSFHGDPAAVEAIAQANRELVSLFEIAQTLSSTLEIDEVLALLAHRNRRLLQAATCVVFLVDESRGSILTARTAVGRHQELLRGARARLGKGVTGKAASKIRPYAGAYDPNDLVFASGEHSVLDLKSCAVAPITSFGRVLGTVNLYDVVPDAFSDHAVCVLTSVAQQAALAINNAYAFERARDSAMRDPLTNLHNGRYLRRCLDQETSRAARLGDSVSVLAIDLDNFKSVNDTYGHQVGDQVLKDITDIFRVQLREYDVAVRTGGDEFVVVLPETPYSEAARTADRIRDAIESYGRTEIGKECVALGASVGVASFPQDATDPEILLSKADQAMYADKRAHKRRNHAA